MSAIIKERIFEELRNYHTNKFPAKIQNSDVDALKNKYNIVEDKIIGMILSMINGKAEFVDSTKELKYFQSRLKSVVTAGKSDRSTELLNSKITKLAEIMALAKESGFKLRKVRGIAA